MATCTTTTTATTTTTNNQYLTRQGGMRGHTTATSKNDVTSKNTGHTTATYRMVSTTANHTIGRNITYRVMDI